jgi:hypothetical protein
MQRTQAQALEGNGPAPKVKNKGPEREKKVRRVVTEEFTQPIEEQQATAPAATPDNEQDLLLDTVDPIDILISELEETEVEQWSIRVDRLPDYGKTGTWASRTGDVEFCGHIPPTPDYLAHAQAMYGPGTYRFILLDGNRKWVKKWKHTISAPVVTQAAQQGTNGRAPVNYIISSQPGQSQQQQAKSVLEQLKEYKEVVTVLSEIQKASTPDGAQTVIAQPAPAESKEDSLQDKITNKLIDYALNQAVGDKDPERVDRLLDRVLGPEDTFSWLQLLKEVAAPLVPALAQLSGALLMHFFGQPQNAGAQARPSSETGDVPDSPTTGIAPRQIPSPALPVDGWTRILRMCVSVFANGLSVDVAATALDDYVSKHPEDKEKAVALIGSAPSEVSRIILSGVGPNNIDEGLFTNWIQELQSALSEEPEQV